MRTPPSRIRPGNDAAPGSGAYVLYWTTAFRRTGWNFALQRAVELATALDRPLVVLDALRVAYPWASDRLHAFVLGGMAALSRRLAPTGALHYPYVEPHAGEGKGLLAALAARAAVVVADDHPGFFLPRMRAAAAAQVRVSLELVDANGIVPLSAADRPFASAFAFRRFLQRRMREYLRELPVPDPLASLPRRPPAVLDPAIVRRWPVADLSRPSAEIARGLPIDHGVPPGPVEGGEEAAGRALDAFLDDRLARYEERSRGDADAPSSSGLSPYLHFGHLATAAVVSALMDRVRWTTRRLDTGASGQRQGWWGLPAPAEAFLDELITWRELGFNMFHTAPGADRYESLPSWARATLEAHAADPRPHVYALEQFEAAETHDPLWNATQGQLRREGRIHGYLRMLWGKKILEWTAHPRDALDVMIHLNNKYALDGRDPNSYSGIFWVLGRYDRPWAPERPVFGTVRYMSSGNTARKLRVRRYIERYATESENSPVQAALWTEEVAARSSGSVK